MDVDLLIEPFDIKLGFRELQDFQALQETMNDF